VPSVRFGTQYHSVLHTFWNGKLAPVCLPL
jgi:hypothetical protein